MKRNTKIIVGIGTITVLYQAKKIRELVKMNRQLNQINKSLFKAVDSLCQSQVDVVFKNIVDRF